MRFPVSLLKPNLLKRNYSSSLKKTLESLIPQERAALTQLKKDHGSKSLGEVTVDQAIGGARGIKSLLWETSLLDAEEGIRFRGHTIPELQSSLPSTVPKGEPTPEALLHLLLTGSVPSMEEAESVRQELVYRATSNPDVVKQTDDFILSLPENMHPMTKLSSAVLCLQTDSQFHKAYADGVAKADYWETSYEDIMNLIARIPRAAALIYQSSFKRTNTVKDINPELDYSENFSNQLGFTDKEFAELMRLYLVIHSDHEGGNASAHATHLVGSTLSDPYLSFSGGLNALAGPLHGLANQEVLRWILSLQEEFKKSGKEVTKETIREFAEQTLASGKVIPGYGHAVLRKTDPRYMAQREFALKYLPDDELFKIVGTIYEVVPDVLAATGKVQNPWPNVDSHSGVLLVHYGLTEENYYTVLFGVSRAIGALSQLFWDRALNLPLERPKSITSDWIRKQFE
eukprot:augustus_masked-scaffold_22-processed-gene-1.36-mRNA-1 protein AED:0.02 eAED:0.02 QI:0/-1/0/1/-1/1/1/0/457